MIRRFRVFVTVGSVAACLFSTALWVRSYWWVDAVAWKVPGPRTLGAMSRRGWVQLTAGEPTVDAGVQPVNNVLGFTRYSFLTVDLPISLGPRWEFGNVAGPTTTTLYAIVPLWFPAAIAGAIAVLPWLRWRFSLRTLLVVMTVVALGLGLAVVLD
jgi:hypothetical protein